MTPNTETRLRKRTTTPLRYRLPRGLVAVAGLAPIVLKVGFREPVVPPLWIVVAQAALLIVYGLLFWLDDRSVRRRAEAQWIEYRKVTRPERWAVVVGVLGCWYWPLAAAIAGLLALIYLTRSYLRLVQTGVPSGLVFIGSFVLLIAVGAAALKLPAATHPDNPINTVDATFTITSAISQTGLIVRPTGAMIDESGDYLRDADGDVIPGFTRFGQIIIMVWIQVGAVGVIVFGALFAQLAGAQFSMRATQTIGESTEQGWAGQLSTQRLVTFILVATHVIELVGAVIFFFGLPDEFFGQPYDWETTGDRVFHSVFLSVSSFCNAGFTTTDFSVEGLRTHWTLHAVIVPLILAGSIGFPALENIVKTIWARIRRKAATGGVLNRLTLNSKLILVSSAALYVVGFVGIWFGELLFTEYDPGVELLDAHFMNMNRTSGFSSVDTASMGLLAHLVLLFLMFIGGAPGSVAGGIKLIVFSVLCLSVWATLRGKDEVTAFGRSIGPAILKKSIAVTILLLAGILLTTAFLVVSEHAARPDVVGDDFFMPLLFEVVSAYATCGLSLGVTDDLTIWGRLAIIQAMFVGRVGVLAVLASIVAVAVRTPNRAKYPHEPVTVY